MDNLDIKNIVIDVDGVLTDNKVWFDQNGNRSKGFNSSDIWAIRELISRGFGVVLVTASTWPGLEEYAKRTGAEIIHSRNKEEVEINDFACIINDVWDYGIAKKAKAVFFPSDAYFKITKHFPSATQINCKGGQGVISHIVGLL